MPKRATAILPIILFCLVFLMGVAKIWDGDAWWHLKTGELIVATRSLPERDVFSFTGGGRWVHDEWLGDVVLYSAYRLGGIHGLTLFTAAAGAAIFLLAFLTARAAGAGEAEAALFLAAAAFAARSRLSERPEILSLLFAAAFVYILTLEARKGKSPLFLLPLLQLLWVNTHPGAVIGAVFVLVAGVSAWIEGKLGKEFPQWDRLPACQNETHISKTTGKMPVPLKTSPLQTASSKKLFAIFTLCILACLVNPYGLHGLTAPFEFIRTPVYMRHIAEWSPVTWKEFSSPRGDIYFQSFRALLLFGIIVFAAGWRGSRVLPLTLFLLTAAMALKSHRFIGMFAIVAAPAVAAQFSQLTRRAGESRAFRAALAVLCALALALGGHRAVFHDSVYTFGFGEHRDFPSGAADFIEDNPEAFAGNMYSAYSFGGYLIHRLHPRWRVFIDGRTTFYGEKFFGEMIDFEAFPEPEKWRSLARKYKLDFAVLSASQRAVSTLLTADPEWALVFWDDRALIFIRRKPDTLAFITRNEYIYTNTFRALAAARRAADAGPRAVAVVREELERPMKREGLRPNPIGLHALGFLEYRAGRLERAERALVMLTRMEPRLAGPHGLLGSVYLRQGRKEDARREFENAARKMPEFHEMLKKLD